MTPDLPPPRCVDCVHNLPQEGAPGVCGASLVFGDPIDQWSWDHWVNDTHPQDPPCPGFRRKEGDDE